jgi:hypothetical protein
VCILDRAPYTNDMTDAAVRTRGASPGGAGGTWVTLDTVIPHWQKVPPQTVGSRMVLSVTTTSEAARFGLQAASLRNASDQFVAPDQAGLLAGVAAMTPTTDEPQVRLLDPNSKASGAYPGTMLTYAAVAVADIDDASDPHERSQYASFIDYAVRAGQTPGLDFGQLPPGYVPLPQALRVQAVGAINAVKAGARPAPAGTTTGSTSGTARPSPAAVPGGGAAPLESAPPTLGPAAAAAVESSRTPGDPAVIARWVLIVGLGVGLLAGAAAPFVRPRRRWRWPTLGARPPD